MARSTRKSITGSAKAAAKKVIPRRGPGSTSGSSASAATKASTKKASTTKAASKKSAPAKKSASKKSAAKKSAPAKKSAAKKSAPAKKSAAKKSAPAKKSASKKSAPAKKSASKKSAPAKKAARSSLVVKDDESAWTKKELDEVLDDLHQHRDRLTSWLSRQEEELAVLMRDSGDGAGADQADVGASSFERDHELTVLNNERDMVAQIDRALARIDDGSYGICESCGNPIGKMRLMAFPRATLCMSCKQREERR